HVKRLVFRGHLERFVRRVRREVSEKWDPRIELVVHPFDGMPEENIGAIAAGLYEFAIVQDRRIEIAVAPRIAARAGIGLPDPAAAVDESFVEAAAARLVRRFIAEVPFPENA